MATTIQISARLQKALTERKLFEKETYEEVIWDLMADVESLDEAARVDLAYARAQIKAGNVKTLAEVKEAL